MSRWGLLIALAGCLILFISLRQWHAPDAPAAPLQEIDAPDVIMSNAGITQYDDDGAVLYQLWSDEIRHFDASERTDLRSPTLELNRAPQPSWSATAGAGEVSQLIRSDGVTEELVELADAVRLTQNDRVHHLELTTASLLVYPQRRFAESDQPVIITSSSGRTTAAGITGDLQSGLLTLSSNSSQRIHSIVLPGQFKLITQP